MRHKLEFSAQIKIAYYWRRYLKRKKKRAAEEKKRKLAEEKRRKLEEKNKKPAKRPGGSGIMYVNPVAPGRGGPRGSIKTP